MSNPEVANIRLCQELYELSTWYYHQTWYENHNGLITTAPAPDKYGKKFEPVCPAYSINYLLDKLPNYIMTKDTRGSFEFFLKKTATRFHAGYNKPESGKWLVTDGPSRRQVWAIYDAETAGDAAAKLAIELHRQGILPGEHSASKQASNREELHNGK